MAGILIVIATRTRKNILHVIWSRSENKSEDCDQSIKPNKTFHFNQTFSSREALRVIFSNNYIHLKYTNVRIETIVNKIVESKSLTTTLWIQCN